MKRIVFFLLLGQCLLAQELPDTGISGVYEVMVGTENAQESIQYFEEFGFTVVDSSEMEAADVKELYGIQSGLKSYRLQNGNIDSHGLIRLLVWSDPTGPGIGYGPAEMIGQRMAVMRTTDIFRLYDIFKAAREDGQQYLPTFPVSDDLFGLDEGEKSFFKRPVTVRENAVYAGGFSHVFFQRYGYHIPGYGSISPEANLKTSEVTHNDFVISAQSMDEMSYLSTALGLKAEAEPSLDGDWQHGPRSVFMMEDGDSHWYQGFVSPNNICGKLKFFIPTTVKVDRSHLQKIGASGITLHSFYTAKLAYTHQLIKEHGLKPSSISKNEYGEDSFVFTGPGGCSWQIIAKLTTKNKPTTELKFELTKS